MNIKTLIRNKVGEFSRPYFQAEVDEMLKSEKEQLEIDIEASNTIKESLSEVAKQMGINPKSYAIVPANLILRDKVINGNIIIFNPHGVSVMYNNIKGKLINATY